MFDEHNLNVQYLVCNFTLSKLGVIMPNCVKPH